MRFILNKDTEKREELWDNATMPILKKLARYLIIFSYNFISTLTFYFLVGGNT